MLVVEQNESGGGDRADAPRVEAKPAQRLEGGREHEVCGFGREAEGRAPAELFWITVRQRVSI